MPEFGVLMGMMKSLWRGNGDAVVGDTAQI